MLKPRLSVALLFVCMVAFALPVAAQATVAPLKGRWVLTLQTPVGVLPIPVSFRPGGTGTADLAGEDVPLVYRESFNRVSISFEVPAAHSPTGQAITFVIRATTTDTTMSGTASMIPDVGETVTGAVNGQRN